MVLRKGKQRLRRPCKKCEKYFLPTGKTARTCEICKEEEKVQRFSKKRKRFLKQKQLKS